MTQHIEEARKLAKDYAVTGIEGAAMNAIAAALAAAEERGRREERELAQKVINEMGRIIGNLQAELDKGKTP